MTNFRFIKLLIGVVLATIPLLMLAMFARILRLSCAEKIPQYFHQFILKFIGVTVDIIGDHKKNVPLIIVANHLSWLDIMVIGASFPCYFVAKSDIASWPILGFLAKVQNTIFVNRKAKGSQISHQVNDLTKALKNNKTIILFPEGTTSDGNRLLPFKSALLAAAQPTPDYIPYIQTLCLKYSKISGMPIHRKERPFVSWYGNMDLLPHVKGILTHSPIYVTLNFGDAVLYADFENRQKLAKYLENNLRNAYTQVNLSK